MANYTVIRQDWIESECGWGIRPDGYTIHLSEADRQAFIDEYWAQMPDRVPDEYSRPAGEATSVEVRAEIYQKLVDQRNSSQPFGISRYGLWF